MKPKNEKPDACKGCPAYQTGIGFVTPDQRNAQPDVTLILDGPGEQEVQTDQPLFFKSLGRRQLNDWMAFAGFDMQEVQMVNVVRCWLPARKNNNLYEGVRAPTVAEADYCIEHHLMPHLRESGALTPDERVDKIIITVGYQAKRHTRKAFGLGQQGSGEADIGTYARVGDPYGKD